MLRLLHFVADSGRNWFLYPGLEYHDQSAFDVRLGTVRPEGPLHQDMRALNISSFSLNCATRRGWPRAILTLAAYLRAERIDVIHTHLFEGCVIGLCAARLAGTRLAVFAGHHSHELPLHGRTPSFLLDIAMSRLLSHRIIAPSQQMKETLITTEGVAPDKISVIPYPIDFGRLRPQDGARERVRRELGLGGKRVIGAMGRLYWVKNYAALISLFAELAPSFPDWVLLLVGDGPERERLRELAASLHIADRVRFAPHRADVADVFTSIDLFVHPSLAESFGLVVVESLALSCPALATDTGIARDVIRDGVNGFLVPPGNPSALRAALRSALEHADLASLGRQGQSSVARFDRQKIVPLYEAWYAREWAARGGARGDGALPQDNSTATVS